MAYKYANPHEWLNEHIRRADRDELRTVAHLLASKLDADAIQDLFEPDMEADGYFEVQQDPIIDPRD